MLLKKIIPFRYVKILIFILLLTFSACGETGKKNASDNNQAMKSLNQSAKDTIPFTINGRIINTQSNTIRFDRIEMGNVNNVTELRIQNRQFEYEGKMSEPALYQFTFSEGQLPVFIAGGNIEIIIDGKDISSYEIKGPNETLEVGQLFRILSEFGQQAQKIRQRIMTTTDGQTAKQLRDSLPIYQDLINKERSAAIVNFIQENKGSVSVLLAATYLDVRYYPDFISELYNESLKKFRNYTLLKQLKNQIDQYIHLANGRTAPEIELVTPEGETISLTSLKGKYVYIDFWAAWCKPCREEHPHLRLLYDKYKDKGFEIYGVNLDNNKEAWLEAIRQDRINWIQVADPDMPGMHAEVANLYRVTHIPHTYLLDREGKIIDRDLRGEALTQKLKTLF